MTQTLAQPAIEVTGVSLTYRLRRQKTLRGVWHRRRHGPETRQSRSICALNDIDLVVKRGSTLGIIGRNGAGKSSLLKVIAGILPPSAGSVVVRGEIGTLLSLGVGFRPQLTGRENVILTGLAAGQSRGDVQARMDDLVAFAGMELFIDLPIHTYSSGMVSRLAFSAATATTPDILMVDEALSAGDAAFRKKARERMEGLMRQSGTVIVVSHSLDSLESLCDQIAWIDEGRLMGLGKPSEIVGLYLDHENVSRREDYRGNL